MAKEMTREELVCKRDENWDDYTYYKNKVYKDGQKNGQYYTLKKLLQKAIEGATGISTNTETLMDTINSGIIFSNNEGYGVKDLEIQSSNMKQVAKNLQPLIDYCNQRMAELSSNIKTNEINRNYHYDLYTKYSTQINLYDRKH